MKTRSQEYAATIFSQVSSIADRPQEDKDKYGSMAHKLPVLIRTAGLSQALAFVDARSEPVQRDTFLSHIALAIRKPSKESLLEASRNVPLGEYMQLTQQVLDALLWYKRFAQSVLKVEAEADPEVQEAA